MLVKENKTILFVIAVILSTSCNNSKLKSEKYIAENFDSNKKIYELVVDSLHFYANSHLETFGVEYLYEWVLDSMLCINSKNDKLVGVVLSSAGVHKTDVTDDATKLLGKKINGNWYFLKGSSLAIPRSFYGKTGAELISFPELARIAREQLLESALIKNNQGEYVVNDKWVDEHFYEQGWGKFDDTAKYDSVHWFYIMDKWNHKIDTNEYKPLKKFKKEQPKI